MHRRNGNLPNEEIILLKLLTLSFQNYNEITVWSCDDISSRAHLTSPHAAHGHPLFSEALAFSKWSIEIPNAASIEFVLIYQQ